MFFAVPEDLRARYERDGQGHVFKFIDEGKCDPSKVDDLVAQLEAIDTEYVNELFKATMEATEKGELSGGELSPPDEVVKLGSVEQGTVEDWRKLGLQEISKGRVAAILLAGGQGTRLGFDKPKGMYKLDIPSGKMLFQLQVRSF